MRRIAGLAVLYWIAAAPPPAYAEPQALGPVPIQVRLNGVTLPLTANSKIDMSTARGDLNAKGDVIVSAPSATLANAVTEISKGLLPYQIPTGKCELKINQIKDVQFFSQSYEIRIQGTAVMSMRQCTVLNSPAKDVPFEFAFQPDPSPQRLGFKLMRTPTIDLPWSWQVAASVFAGKPEDLAEEAINGLAEKYALLVPKPYGARIAIQGASVSGDKQTVSFLLRGDAHIDARNLTSLIAALVQQQDLSFTVALPTQPLIN